MAINANEITDGITSGIEVRQQRGLEIAALTRIAKAPQPREWIVPSQSGNGKYRVVLGDDPHCTCPDHETRGCKCKHIYAVEYTLRREKHADGSVTLFESLEISKALKRPTYSQNWPAYNAAQTSEKGHFQSLLFDLCQGVEEPQQTKGRPRLPLRDAIFAVTFKIYSTVSGRRFISDLCDARARGYISKVPHFNSIFNYLEDPDLSPILTGLIERASLPLTAIETDFAADSTGFTSSRFHRWYDHKYGTREQHTWVKAHIMCGVKTNIVTAVEIHQPLTGDVGQLPALVEATAKNFKISEVSADKAYGSERNFAAIENVGAQPFIPFRANTNPKLKHSDLWEKAWHFFSLKRDEFLAHYHKRSNVESTVSMIKAKFRDHVRSKTDVAMKNEVLCKVLCHNICCLISAIHELGITPDFGCTNKGSPAQNLS
jgi:transposase